MKAKKKATYPMDKCYAIAELEFDNKHHIVVAAEKTASCVLFDMNGNFEETVWEGPSGTMSIVPLSSKTGAFLATKKMYSPNDSKEAEIVLATREKGKWQTKTLAVVPFAHRFDVLKSNLGSFILVSTMKSGHDFKDDWTHPGQVLVSPLPKDLDDCTKLEKLEFQAIANGFFKNHGYTRRSCSDGTYCVISAETGIYEIKPPTKECSSWQVKCLLDEPTSDICFADLDNDNEDEMLTFSPFHGDTVKVYHKGPSGYDLAYECPTKLEFAHALCSVSMKGKNSFVIGHRKGEMNMYNLFYENGKYQMQMLDPHCGSTNVYVSGNLLVSTNREINEIAFYELVE